MSTVPTPSPEQLLGEAPPPVSFGSIGEKVRGSIVSMDVAQQRTYDPTGGIGAPAFWPDGRPKWHTVITLQTGTGGKDDPHNGLRRLFVKDGSQMATAFRQAIKDSGRAAPSVGSFLQVIYVSDEPAKGGGTDKKIYEVTYVPQDQGARSQDKAAQTAHQEALQGEGF